MAVDFSDLPKPSQTDFSDLPTPKAPSAPKASTASPEKPFEDRLKDIGVATGVGTAAGAFSPEIAFGTGLLLEKFPLSPPPVRAAGKAMQAAAPSMTGAKGRALGSLAGGFGGLTSETAGQAAELFGASPPVAESARIVGGLLPLEAVTSGTRGVGSLISMVKPGAGAAYNVMRSVMQDVGVANLAGKQRELVMQRIEELRKSPFTTDAQRKIYDTISDSVSKATNLAEAEANLARSTAGAQASGVRSTAQQVSREEREKGVRLAATRGELEETKKTLLDRAKSGLREVGDATVELSQMGRTLRDRILQRFETGSLERSEAYKQQKALRDQAVAAKESQGILVESLPEYKTLVQDLRNKLLKGQIAQQQKTAPVTEPGVLKAYQNIHDAVTARRVEVGVNEMGNSVYKTFPTSFDALDDVRRRLGDAAFGKQAEGYEALGQKIAQE